MTVRTTQEVVEVAVDATTNKLRTTQEVVEVAVTASTNKARNTQTVVEVATTDVVSSRISGAYLNVLVQNTSYVTKNWSVLYNTTNASFPRKDFAFTTASLQKLIPGRSGLGFRKHASFTNVLGHPTGSTSGNIYLGLIPNEVGIAAGTYWQIHTQSQNVYGGVLGSPFDMSFSGPVGLRRTSTWNVSLAAVGDGAVDVTRLARWKIKDKLGTFSGIIGYNKTAPAAIALGFNPTTSKRVSSVWNEVLSFNPSGTFGVAGNRYANTILGLDPRVTIGASVTWNVASATVYPQSAIYGTDKNKYGVTIFAFTGFVGRSVAASWNVKILALEALYGDAYSIYGQIGVGLYPSIGRSVSTSWNAATGRLESVYGSDDDQFGSILYGFVNQVGIGRNTSWVTNSNGVNRTRTTTWNVATPAFTGARLSQSPVEILTIQTPGARLSQAPVEILTTQTPGARLSQAVVEVLIKSFVPPVRITKASTDVIFVPANPPVRLTKASADVAFIPTNPPVRITKASADVAFAPTSPPVRITKGWVDVLLQLPVGTASITGDTTWAVDSNFVVTQVSIQGQAIWFVDKTISTTHDTTWNVLFGAAIFGQVDLSGSTTWNDHVNVGRNRTVSWNVGGHSLKAITTYWNVVNPLPKFDFVSGWWMADKGVTVDGLNGVSNWKNWSGTNYFAWDGTQNHDAYQTSTFSRPALVSGELNGLPVVRFDGTTDHLKIYNDEGLVYNGSSGHHFFAVVRDSRADSVFRCLFGNTNIGSLDTSYFVGTVGSGPTKIRYTEFNGGDRDTTEPNGRGDIDAGNWVIFEGEVNKTIPGVGGRPVTWVNEAQQPYNADTGTGSLSWYDPYYIGKRGALTEGYWQGDIAELIIYGATPSNIGFLLHGELSDAERYQVESYLKAKWFGTYNVYKSSQTTWNVQHLATVPVQCQAIWNTNHYPNQIGIAKWNVVANPPSTVSRQRTATWNVAAVASQTGDTTWNVQHLPMVGPDPAQVIWNVQERPHVGPDPVDVLWNTDIRVAAPTVQTTWRVRRSLRRTRSTLWNDRIPAARSGDATWNTDGKVAVSADTTWTVFKAIPAKAFFRPAERTRWEVLRDSDTTVNLQQYSEWDVHVTVGRSRNTAWNVQAVASATHIVRFNDCVPTSQTRTTTWNDYGRVPRAISTYWYSVIYLFLWTARWNTCTKISLQHVAKWKVIAYNSNTSDTYWNDTVLAGRSRTTTWNTYGPPVQINRDTTWNLNTPVALTSSVTKWNVLRSRPKRSTTYWDVITSAVSCVATTRRYHVPVRIRARWKVDRNAASVTRVIRWNQRRRMGKTGTTNWMVRKPVSKTNVVRWRVSLYTTNTSIGTTWSYEKVASLARMTQWNVRHLMVGTLTRPTTWEVRNAVGTTVTAISTWNVSAFLLDTAVWNTMVLASKSAATSWPVRLTAGTSASTTWAIGVKTTAGTTWNTAGTAAATADANYKVFKVAAATADVSWNTRKTLVAATTNILFVARKLTPRAKPTFWDYSVVGTSVGTNWKDKATVNYQPDPDRTGGIPTMWNVFYHCGPVFLTREQDHVIRNKDPRNKGLVPKITVCEISRDRQRKGYVNKFLK